MVSICDLLGLSHSVYYAKQKRKKRANVRLEAAMRQIHTEMDGTYGSRRMCIELNEQGYQIGRYKVRGLMKALGLVAKRPGKHRYPANQGIGNITANHMNRQFNPVTQNTHWSGDITYIRTQQGWLYLAVVIELYSRRVISAAFSHEPNSELTIRALQFALEKRRPAAGLMFHSDQGCQYTSMRFQDYLRDKGCISSMSRAGNCLDNAVSERFFRSLKSERVHHRHYATRQQAIHDITDYIELFYNAKRRHAKLGNISPIQFENKYG